MQEVSKGLTRIAFLPASLLLAAGLCHGSPVTLSDGPTTFVLDPASQAGMSSWNPGGGPNIMPQQWIWYGVNSSGFNQSPLQSLDMLATPDVIFDPLNPAFAEVTYTSSVLSADLMLNIADGSPSALGEQLT